MFNVIVGSAEVEQSFAQNTGNLGLDFVFDGFSLNLVIGITRSLDVTTSFKLFRQTISAGLLQVWQKCDMQPVSELAPDVLLGLPVTDFSQLSFIHQLCMICLNLHKCFWLKINACQCMI